MKENLYLIYMIENIATIAAAVFLYWLSDSWWSMLLLLNLNVIRRNRQSGE